MIQIVKSSPSLAFVLILWVVFWVDFFIPGFTFRTLGIIPRDLDGLKGILFSPFIHGHLGHLISNSLPLIVLPAIGSLALSNRKLIQVMTLGALGSGLGTWLFGGGAIVIGASGVVFALLGYLVARAFYAPTFTNIIVSGLALVLYGGAVASLLTMLPTVSWAAHFWGFVTGILLGRFLSRKET